MTKLLSQILVFKVTSWSRSDSLFYVIVFLIDMISSRLNNSDDFDFNSFDFDFEFRFEFVLFLRLIDDDMKIDILSFAKV
jgi:hypothetical protein